MMGAESWRRLEGVHIFSHFTPHRKEIVTSYFVLFAASAFEKVCFESVAGERRVEREGECSPKKPQLVPPSRVPHLSNDLSWLSSRQVLQSLHPS